MGGTASIPTSYYAAGALDNWNQGDNVIGFKIGFDHAIDLARSKHRKSVAIAAIAGKPHFTLDAAEGFELVARVQ